MPKIESISKWGAYGYASAVVDGVQYRRDLMFLPNGTLKKRPGGFGWWGAHKFNKKEFDYLKKAGANKAIIGIGMNKKPKASVPGDVKKYAKKIGLDLTILPSQEAVEQWNELSEDDKNLAAIIHITC